jgi:hypothetical protein
VLDVHGLAVVHVAAALAALEHHDVARVGPGGGVQLGQPVGGDRAAEAGAGDKDVDLFGYCRYPFLVRSRASLRL